MKCKFTYECSECGNPCQISGDHVGAPGRCPYNVAKADWREVAEPAALPKLTVEDSKPKLPDWCKVGAWAAVGNFVGKIDWLSRDGSECRITCGESRFAKRDEVKAVTWRAWTFEEAPEEIDCWINGILRTAKITRIEGESCDKPIYGYGIMGVLCFMSFEWMLNNAIQLNGLPCGVPQVEGKDLEG